MDTVATSYKQDSKSTDKLQILADVVNRLPDEAFARISSFSLTWEVLTDDTIVPCVNVEFLEA